jgi:hypothetical protein
MSSAQLLQQAVSQNHQDKPRKVNPVYKALRAQAHAVAAELRAEWDEGKEAKTKLGNRNKGVRCFMKKQDIVDDGKDMEALLAEMRVPETDCSLEISSMSAVDTVLSDPDLSEDTMAVMYSPSSSPCDLIYGGIPSEVSDLASRSTLIWQLKAPALHLSESEDLCELFAMTSFYLPNVEVRKAPVDEDYVDLDEKDRTTLNLTMMSSVEAVVSHMEANGRHDDIRLSKLIYWKLLIPFCMALRQNQNRKKLGLSPIRNIVVGDMGLRTHEKGVNTLFSQQLYNVVKYFDGCFDRVIVCSNPSTLQHVAVYFKVQTEEN